MANDRLVYLVSAVLKRPALLWILEHLPHLLTAWLCLTFLLWFGLMGYGAFMPAPNYNYRTGTTLSVTLYDIWHSGLMSWVVGALTLAFYATVAPALLILPFMAMVVFSYALVAIIGGSIVIIAGGSLLVYYSPWILAAIGRALFFWFASKCLAYADQHERTEAAVMAALGDGEASLRAFDGKARLMGPDEVNRFNAKPKRGAGTLIGKVDGEDFYNFTEKHVLIVAGTRGGKGRDLIIPNLGLYQGSVFVLDPKGENAQRTHEARRQFGYVLTLDPFGVSGLPSSRFNPLRFLKGESMITDVQTLADALIIGTDYFSSSARLLLTGLILYVVAEPVLKEPDSGQPAQRDLITVRRFLMRGLGKTLEAMVANKAPIPTVRELIADVGEWGLTTADKEWSGIRNSAIEQTKWINAPEFKAVLESGDGQVNFPYFLEGVMSVYVCLPAPYFATFNRWLRLVVAAAIDAMTKRLAPPPLPVRFVLDEVAQLGNLAKIESALTLSAGYGVQLWGVWQHIKDIERCYPSSGIGGWVSSSGLRLVFAVQDNETIHYFATASGQALTETDIRQLPPKKILCMMDGENPILVDR